MALEFLRRKANALRSSLFALGNHNNPRPPSLWGNRLQPAHHVAQRHSQTLKTGPSKGLYQRYRSIDTQLMMEAEGICGGETLDFLLNERHGVEAEESSRLASWVSSGSPLLGAAIFRTLTAPTSENLAKI